VKEKTGGFPYFVSLLIRITKVLLARRGPCGKGTEILARAIGIHKDN